MNFYRNEHKGLAEDAEFVAKAADLVDFLTHGRIAAAGFENLTKFQQDNVRRAACLMVDHFANQQQGGDVASYGLGDIRVTKHKKQQKPWDVAGCGIWAWMTLMQTGLMRA